LGGYMKFDFVSVLNKWHDILFVVPAHISL